MHPVYLKVGTYFCRQILCLCFVVIILWFWLYFDNIICNMAKRKKELNFDYFSRVVSLPFEEFDPKHMDPKYASVEEYEKV